jgi:hypothetical protein
MLAREKKRLRNRCSVAGSKSEVDDDALGPTTGIEESEDLTAKTQDQPPKDS